ncbi:MAG: sodium:proton antiporter [Deltaproteobacteria bacterium]|nr:sodium:proton antiporter [Deltaproteobacteria bacterium]MBW2384183.1 sodium:proton antiporter [Deltaproteobacteria bacterium]MBW2698924.1 sodium:proton antiporter [Deltaproteobacteria bacterium]
MDGFQIIALLITLAALFSYLNHRFLGLPTTIGLMVFGLLTSFCLIAAGRLVPELESAALALLERIDFDDTLMHGMLGFLLFAGALHVDLEDLAAQKGVIALLASVGLLISTAVVAVLTWGVLRGLGIEIPFMLCLLFGALISPTDPIAVLAILKTMSVPKSLETKITGESLFNDGLAVVVFLAISGAAGLGGGHTDEGSLVMNLLRLFALETIGGAVFGAAVGWIAFLAFRSVDSYEVEILISLALVSGGYALAQVLHVSGPIAMVVAGLLIGNHGRRLAMSDSTREHLDTFWKLMDEILNAILFVLIGLEVIVLSVHGSWLAAAVLAIPITLVGRALGVGIPLTALRRLRRFTPHAAKVLTWGGLRGGISVALALSLSGTLGRADRDAYEGILLMTYVAVSFSILVQGLTMAPLLRRLGVDRELADGGDEGI